MRIYTKVAIPDALPQSMQKILLPNPQIPAILRKEKRRACNSAAFHSNGMSAPRSAAGREGEGFMGSHGACTLTRPDRMAIAAMPRRVSSPGRFWRRLHLDFGFLNAGARTRRRRQA